MSFDVPGSRVRPADDPPPPGLLTTSQNLTKTKGKSMFFENQLLSFQVPQVTSRGSQRQPQDAPKRFPRPPRRPKRPQEAVKSDQEASKRPPEGSKISVLSRRARECFGDLLRPFSGVDFYTNWAELWPSYGHSGHNVNFSDFRKICSFIFQISGNF